MTIRQRLNRERRRSFLLAITGFVMFAGGMTASQRHREFFAIGLCGFVLFGGSIIYTMFCVRCVHCQRPLGKLFSRSSGSPSSIDSELAFCPYCRSALP